MDLKQDRQMRQNLAKEVQVKLNNHKVNPEEIGATVDFLAEIIGGIAFTVFPNKEIEDVIGLIKDQIERGMEEGISDD